MTTSGAGGCRSSIAGWPSSGLTRAPGWRRRSQPGTRAGSGTSSSLLYANQGAENSGWIDGPVALGAIADKVGVDASRFHDERQSSAVARVVSDSTLQARTAGINSTPTFYAGRTGGALRPLNVTSLDADALRPALDTLLAS